MSEHDDNVNDILAAYEKQFQDTEGYEKIARAQSLINNKLHAVVNELARLALHAEKEEVRVRAGNILLERAMGKVGSAPNDPADDMFKQLEAKSKERARRSEQSRKNAD